MIRYARVKLAPFALLAIVASAMISGVSAQEDITYQKPPKEILQLVDVAQPPAVVVGRDGRFAAILTRPGFKSLEELSEPELRLAGLRINPRNHNRARTNYAVGIEFLEIATGKRIPVAGLPAKIRIEWNEFSPRSRYFSFLAVEPEGMSLWIADVATGNASKLTPADVSAVLDWPYQWSPDESAVYVHVRPSLDPYSEERVLPAGPVVQEAKGGKTPGRTWQDLLRSKSDERKFDHYVTTEVRRFSLAGQTEPVLPKAIYRAVTPSPDGKFLLVESVHGPYSYQYPLERFPYRAFIADAGGKAVVELADKPLADMIPIAFDASEPGRREFMWRADADATVVWAEAQDGGDPAKDVPVRDRIFQMAAPFAGGAKPLCATRNRFQGIVWGEGGIAVISDFRWKDRNVKQYLVRTADDNPEPRVLFDFSSESLYGLPGDLVTVPNALGQDVLLTNKDRTRLYLQGEGYGPEGNRPFLDELEIASGKATRLWRADGVKTYEQIVRVLDVGKKLALTRIQSQKDFPNLYLRKLGAADGPRQITSIPNPYKAFEGVSKQKIKYKREDGVELSADLYLPAGYAAASGGRLPMLMEAYPTEFKDKKAAGMVDSSPHQFVYLSWGSPVFWAARGYAVLEGAQFPIVGEGSAEPNDTYIEQLVADARAAIKAVDEMGVVDPQKVAVMGHSYGAFMTVNLLAHSDLFAAGIARSGAYNRSLTPFGFQAEERSYWQAQEVYQRMSPFNFADKIHTPLLLIHGEADNNPGTFTLQSERLFQAVKGLGGRARLVLLPFESHGYAAKENIFHMLWEMDTWLETNVRGQDAKRAGSSGPPAAPAAGAGATPIGP